jgi:nucleotide-binding universal stress UspA family protein
MTTKLLAVIAEAATAPACLDAAEAAAEVLGNATIEALHVVVDPDYLAAAPEEISLQQLRIRHEGSAGEREAATLAAYEHWVAEHPNTDIPIVWKERLGCEEENVEQEARVFDVLVLARPTNMDGGDALHAAIHRIRHPFFLVPSRWRLLPGDTFAEHIVVAWNDTEACRRSLEGALPWLRVARDVTVLLVDEDIAIARSAEDLLKQNDIGYRRRQVARDRETLGDQLVTEAHDLGADMLVMGTYRHNQFVEWLLGGTTRHVLARFDLPLFLAH